MSKLYFLSTQPGSQRAGEMQRVLENRHSKHARGNKPIRLFTAESHVQHDAMIVVIMEHMETRFAVKLKRGMFGTGSVKGKSQSTANKHGRGQPQRDWQHICL